MGKINNLQMFCLLVILATPVSFLQQPGILCQYLSNNGWLAPAVAFLPGLFIIMMYDYIIRKSHSPFPLLLEEHLGKLLGRSLSLLYIFFFLFVASFTLRLFVDFIDSNVLSQTPISVFIIVLLFMGFYAIRTGMQSIIHVCEIIAFIGITFSLLIIALGIAEYPRFGTLMPVAYMKWQSLGLGMFNTVVSFSLIQPVLTFAFFSSGKGLFKVMLWVMATFLLLIGATTMATFMSLGDLSGTALVFPTFSMVRLLRVGDFIQNIDIIFIGIWILGIFGAVTIPWLMSCYCTQQVLSLKDYSFMGAPTALIIGTYSILMAKNILEVRILSVNIVPVVYAVFLIGIPLLVFISCLFKSGFGKNQEPESSSSQAA